jgi:type I restriction-modification system DNA methylase subunit
MNQINTNNFKEKVNSILYKYSNRFDLSSSYNFFISCYSFICISEILKNSDNISLVDEINNIDETEDINECINNKIKDLNQYDELKNIFPPFGKKKSLTTNENPLFELIEGFTSILHEIDLSQYGEAFSLILDQVFKTISHKGGSYYTPPSIADLLVSILNPEKNRTIYDPTCASGNLLVKAAKFVNEKENTSSKFELYGQDINNQLLQISRQYAFITGSSNTSINLGYYLLMKIAFLNMIM